MKKLILMSTLLTLSFNPLAYAAHDKAYVDVNGLVCDFCARALEKVFGKQDAVNTIGVDMDTKVITIDFKADKTLDDATITTLVTDAGYNVVAIRRKADKAAHHD